MKVHVVNHQTGGEVIEANSGVRITDGQGKEFLIKLNELGELEVVGIDGGLDIQPMYSNHIIIKQR